MGPKGYSGAVDGASVARVHCRLEFRYPSPEIAGQVLQSVEQENLPYVKARIEGDTLVSETEADSLESLLHTLDDYLACVSVAEKMLRA